MPATVERKKKVIEDYKTHETDTGSPEVQVAVLTDRINHLTEHLKVHRKDFSSRRGLLMLVSQRSQLLKFLQKNNRKRYTTLIKKLGIRK